MTIHNDLLKLKKEVSDRLHHLAYDLYVATAQRDPTTNTSIKEFYLYKEKISCNVEWRRAIGSGVDLRIPISELRQSGVLYSTDEPLQAGWVIQLYQKQVGGYVDLGYYLIKSNSSPYVSHYTTLIEKYERFVKDAN